MPKIKRGNYHFIAYIGDHGHHVHVYKEGHEVLKWDLDEKKAIKGRSSKRLLKMIRQLQKEGKL